MSKLKKAFKHPGLILIHLAYKGFFNWMPDKPYLKMMFKLNMGQKLNLKNPKTYSEKLQWLKLYDRKSEYSKMVDKYECKEYVAGKIGIEHIIPTLGVWDRFDDIDFDALPEQFVLKCTHDSGGLVICTDKSKLDLKQAKRKIEKSLKTNYYKYKREWPYKNVKPRIIAEKYMVDESGYELKDYKFFCFDGTVKAMFIASDRSDSTTETKFDFYDENFNHLPFTNGHPNSERVIEKPKGFEKMKELASVLSKGLPQARIDFYDVDGHIYFGEITFFHWSGMKPFEPSKWDDTFGSLIKLPDIHKK